MTNVKDILLVDLNDNIQGYGEKLEIHQKGVLHRAFSVFLFDSTNKLILLQKRASSKYHSAGLWSNACCGHPLDEMNTGWYAQKRLKEEMGIYCELTPQFKFTYHAKLDKGLIEHEIDHVYRGVFNGTPSPNPNEVEDYRWISKMQLYDEILAFPQQFSVWFNQVIKHYFL